MGENEHGHEHTPSSGAAEWKIGDTTYFGVHDKKTDVLLLNGAAPRAREVCETASGLWHVSYVQPFGLPGAGTYAVYMKPGPGPGVRPPSA